jgi:hypothetical protein
MQRSIRKQPATPQPEAEDSIMTVSSKWSGAWHSMTRSFLLFEMLTYFWSFDTVESCAPSRWTSQIASSGVRLTAIDWSVPSTMEAQADKAKPRRSKAKMRKSMTGALVQIAPLQGVVVTLGQAPHAKEV